jgi:glycosyltransferase involved in cell wall biosynthesis
LRILLVSFVENNRWSGMGKWSHEMAGGLSRLGQRPALWFAGDFPRTSRTGRLSVLFFPFVLAARLWRHRGEFDAVVVHEPCGLWYGLLRRMLSRLPPLVVMCHNVESRHFAVMLLAARQGQAFISKGTRIKTPLLRLWQSDNAIRLADEVVCLSSVDREYVTQHLRRTPERVTLQINGVECESFTKRREPSSESRVLFVGGWLDVKGRRLLPSIWSSVRAQLPQARLTIVGSGQPASAVLEDFAERDRASVNVIPRLSNEAEMTAQYAAHELFLMPSLSEGSPLSLLEAMASALPVVAARVGGVPDIISHGKDGLLFDIEHSSEAAAQVCRLLSEPESAARLGHAAKERARVLTWTASARTLLTAVEHALISSRHILAATGEESRTKPESEFQTEQEMSK